MKKSLSLACLLALAATPGTGIAAPAISFTAAQAAHGAELYRAECALCHGATLAGSFETPPLTGRFAANWAGAPLRDLYDYIRKAMPQMAPNTLSGEDTAAIVAFLLQSNGAAPGATPLPDTDGALKSRVFPRAGARLLR